MNEPTSEALDAAIALQKELDRIECDENQPRIRCLAAIRRALTAESKRGYDAAIAQLHEGGLYQPRVDQFEAVAKWLENNRPDEAK